MSWFSRFFRQSKQNPPIQELINQLKKDFAQHQDVGKPASDEQIASFEEKTGFQLPPSFRKFVKDFGNGAYWLYGTQPIDSLNQPKWAMEFHQNLTDSVPIDNGNLANKDSLLCLMTEDSNGGSWCWLTEEKSLEEECPLAYLSSGTLYYKLPSFLEWLTILVNEKQEVIRFLDYDKADKLELG